MKMEEPEKRRRSKPAKAQVERDPKEVARIEAENGLRQFDFVIEEIDKALQSDSAFVLRPSLIQKLNRLAIENISELPGVYRPGGMEITDSAHEPPSPEEVPENMESLCDYINGNRDASPWHLAAYAMWRLNWLHPFEDGNGRTARAVSYLVLCVRLGQKLPGKKTIPEFIADIKQPYYDGLEAADLAHVNGKTDVSSLEEIMKSALAAQLAEFHQDVTGQQLGDSGSEGLHSAVTVGASVRRRDSLLHRLYNRNPFWFWLAGVIIAVVVAVAFA